MGKFYKSAEQYYDEMESTQKDVSTKEHSFIYNANMPVAYVASYQSMILDELEKKMHAKSALENGYYDDLIERCEDYGITRILATKATGEVTITGNPGSKLPANSIVGENKSITFVTDSEIVIGQDGKAKVTITASDYGSKYNCEAGAINNFPIKYEGIFTVTNEKAITNGYDYESYDHLYQRYKERVSEIIVAGNVAWYKALAKEVTGVGDCKGYECMDENSQEANGHVLLVITDANRRKASEELIKNVSDHLEENRLIGVKLHILSAKELTVNVYAKIVYNSKATTQEDVKKDIENAIQEKFKKMDFYTEYVSIAGISSIIYELENVIDVREIKLNDLTQNVDISNNEIPVFGTLTLEVV